MKLRLLVILALTLVAASACVIEPIGERRAYYHDEGPHNYGHRVWHH